MRITPRVRRAAALLGVALGLAGSASAQSPAEQLALIFRPFETDQMTLSPDGRRLAYTERVGDELTLVIRDLDTNKLVRVPIGVARAGEMSGAKEKTPAHLTFLQWATAERLVFNLNGENVCSIKADGSGGKRLADPKDFQDLPVPLSPGAGTPASGSVPGSVLGGMKNPQQPVNVVALPRGGKYVYVEALAKDRTPAPQSIPGLRNLPGVPRVVYRIDVETGRFKEMGEVIPRATVPLVDHAGYPRLARLQPTQRTLTTDFVYGGRRGDKWLPLDQVLGPQQALTMHYSPANFLAERSVPLGFDYNPDLLYYASNVGRDTYGIYTLDLKNKQRTAMAVETPAADFIDPAAEVPGPLVFDEARRKLVGVRYTGAERATAWLDPELAGVQRTLSAALPGRTAQILEWNDARDRYLVLATGHAEPGIYYLFQPATNELGEIMSRAPWLPEMDRSPGLSFGFRTAAGIDLTGYLTLPKNPRLKRAPLVALCHDGPWSRDQPEYNRWVQALASMGFAIVQVNYRGSTGFGQKHLQALRAGPDTVPLEDIVATVDWVIQGGHVNPKLVAIMGEGYGGYLALRALQLHPEKFRCAVTVNAPTDLAAWLSPPEGSAPSSGIHGASKRSRPNLGDTQVLSRSLPPAQDFTAELRRNFLGSDPAQLRAISPAGHPELVRNPVMLIQADSASAAGGRQFADDVRQAGATAVFLGLNQDEAADLPQARAALFQQVEGFLNEHIYNYNVKLGELELK